jgi:hypothetical protein
MLTLRCTKKLLARVPRPSAIEVRSTTRLGDWYGTLFGVGHRRMALFISAATRLPVVMPARGLKNVGGLLPPAVGVMLLHLGIPEPAVEEELEAMRETFIAPTNDRSLLGTLNEFIFMVKLHLDRAPETGDLALALWLSKTPVGPMKYEAPDNATRRLFGLPSGGRRTN